jgi:hypothetical protein
MNKDEIEVQIPVARPAITGLGATIGYALFTTNSILPMYGFDMGIINGVISIVLFGLIHAASGSMTKMLNRLYYEIAMDKATLKYLINKGKEDGTLPLDLGLNPLQGEDNE